MAPGFEPWDARAKASSMHGTATDPLTYATGLIVLMAVCALACVLPTRRALSVNPTIALRCE